jgi:nucleotide-binding universal stress UspA family protein
MPKASTPRMTRVLVAIDFDEPATVAASWVANHFAREAELILAHIIEPPPATRSNVMRYPSLETIVNKAHLEVEKRLVALCESVAPGRARAEIRVGIPHDELVVLAMAIGADIIVVGRPNLESSGWARIGATAQRILRKSTIPVLLVANAERHPPQRFLVAIDESNMTDDVLSWGAFLSHRFSGEATVVHAAGLEEPQDEEEWITGEIERYTGWPTVEQRVTRSKVRPAESIIEEARAIGSDMIVIGSSGAGAADQLLFGSVAESVLLSSPCPVLVVVPGQARI